MLQYWPALKSTSSAYDAEGAMWLVATEAIPMGGEIRIDCTHARTEPAAPPALFASRDHAAGSIPVRADESGGDKYGPTARRTTHPPNQTRMVIC